MVGGLVEQQQVGRQRERERERRALALAAGCRLGNRGLVEAEAMQEFDQARFDAPALALVVCVIVGRIEAAAQRQAFAQRRCGRQHGLLFDQHDAQAVAPLYFAVVEIRAAGDDVEQRRLAGAVAADEADALAVVDGQCRLVEQRVKAVREFGVLQGDQHGVRDDFRQNCPRIPPGSESYL